MTLRDLQRRLRTPLVLLPAAGLLIGLGLKAADRADAATLVWIAATLPVLAALLVEIVASLRQGEVGLDIVAALSMTAALVFGESLAAVVVALMYAGGQHLEAYAERRARREMTALLARAPRTALRYEGDGLAEVPAEALTPGDRILVRRGDVVAADGTVDSGLAVLDESALTGESLPVRHAVGDAVMSGATNAGDAFDLGVTRRSADSTYAGIVRLVEQAERAKAPMARLADRFSLVFLAVTLLIAGGAWLVSGDPIRAVAVLVVATPCPLILAVPVALVAGLSRAARAGILVKGGKVLEQLARIRVMVVDKTGTLTEGRARLAEVATAPGRSGDEVLRLAASLDQASQHVMAATIVRAAEGRGLSLALPTEVTETAGEGLLGRVEGHDVLVGGTGFAAAALGIPAERFRLVDRTAGAVTVAVAIDGDVAGELILSDPLRQGITDLLEALRAEGVDRIVLASGDRADVAEVVGRSAGVDVVAAGLTPERKVEIVVAERAHGPVMMVGDGVNDAPALAAADVGVAMGARGAAASAEAADAVLLVDRLDRVLPAIRIAKRSRAIALQSVYVGIGLSVAGMIAAAFGYLQPVEGAILQEVIDVAVILNALRALWGPDAAVRSKSVGPAMAGGTA